MEWGRVGLTPDPFSFHLRPSLLAVIRVHLRQGRYVSGSSATFAFSDTILRLRST